MLKVLLFFVGAVILSETNGALMPSESSTDDSDEELGYEDWNEPAVQNSQISGEPYSEDFQILHKRSGQESLMRRSTLDKNFMRFGRSGFFPEERCCKQRDLVGYSRSWPSLGEGMTAAKKGTDSNFIRFGRAGKDNFIRFGRADNFMRFGKAEKDNFMRFGRRDNFMRFGRPDKDNFMRFGKAEKDNFIRFGRSDNFMRFGRPNESADQDRTDRDGPEDRFTRSSKGDNFMRFGRDVTNEFNYGEWDGLRKSDGNGTSDEGGDVTDDAKPVRRKRMASEPDRVTLIETAEDYLSRPNVLRFITAINANRPATSPGSSKPLPAHSRYRSLTPDVDKRKHDGSYFIRFG